MNKRKGYAVDDEEKPNKITRLDGEIKETKQSDEVDAVRDAHVDTERLTEADIEDEITVTVKGDNDRDDNHPLESDQVC